jgi:hypothetical protein
VPCDLIDPIECALPSGLSSLGVSALNAARVRSNSRFSAVTDLWPVDFVDRDMGCLPLSVVGLDLGRQ